MNETAFSMESLSNIELPDNWNISMSTGNDSFDELLGNCWGVYGARPGKLVLFSAQSGTGKTRLCLTIGQGMVSTDSSVRYGHFTGEQSVMALAIMGKTMNINFGNNMMASSESYWPTIANKIICNKINVAVIDSFPMLQFPNNTETRKPLDTKERVGMIAKFAEENNVSIILLNHTDKKGNRGGRNELLHLVDVAYTMRKVTNEDAYGGEKVVEFHCDKNREGSPVSRAFPFNGVWHLDAPHELESSNGNETGDANGKKISARKSQMESALMDAIRECNNSVLRQDVEDGTFSVPGFVKSTLISTLKKMTENGILRDFREKVTPGRGKASIVRWVLVDDEEDNETIAEEEEDNFGNDDE